MFAHSFMTNTTYIMYREMKKLAQLRVQQNISIDRKLVLMRQEEEKKVLDMQRQLSQEQTKSKQKESEIEELKGYMTYTYTRNRCKQR